MILFVNYKNPSGGLVTPETGSLDRAKAALERRKQKTSVSSYGTMTSSTTGAEPDLQVLIINKN